MQINEELYKIIIETISDSIQKALLCLNEDGECCDCGTAGMYNNAFNTVGMGDIVPAGMNTIGSGDRFDNFQPDKSKKKKKTNKRKIKVYTKR